MKPVVLQDTREQWPLQIAAFPVEVGTLPVGDYGLKGFSDWQNPGFVVERKTLDDLIQSLVFDDRSRFLREIEKLRQFRFRGLLVEGHQQQVATGDYRSKATPESMTASLDALSVRAGIHIFWCGDHDGAARQLEGLVRQFVRGIEKDWKRLGGGADRC